MRARFVLGHQPFEKRSRALGQGVIEYSGALVIAAVVVAMGLTILPPNIASYVHNIQAGILQFLLSKIPT